MANIINVLVIQGKDGIVDSITLKQFDSYEEANKICREINQRPSNNYFSHAKIIYPDFEYSIQDNRIIEVY